MIYLRFTFLFLYVRVHNIWYRYGYGWSRMMCMLMYTWLCFVVWRETWNPIIHHNTLAVYLYYGHRKHYGQNVRFVLAFRQFSQFSRGTRKWALELKPPPTSRILDRTGNYFSTYGEESDKIHLCRDPNLWDSRRKIRNKPPWPRRDPSFVP